ncbi:hypothetical protein GCM10010464_49890 [Pseudonocardia yunnanensis]|uniref:Uncharacterized protein n=1 Tax=Pseudonocardia yunnanensis TaxID=58107 RepID=A0ABW4EQI0_9PSEU
MTTPTSLHLAGTDTADHDFWRGQSMITLSRVSARSILGLFGIAAATSMVAVNLAAWRSSTNLPLALFPSLGRLAVSRSSWPTCGPTAL